MAAAAGLFALMMMMNVYWLFFELPHRAALPPEVSKKLTIHLVRMTGADVWLVVTKQVLSICIGPFIQSVRGNRTCLTDSVDHRHKLIRLLACTAQVLNVLRGALGPSVVPNDDSIGAMVVVDDSIGAMQWLW